MGIGNILLSVILHAAIIAVAFSFNVRDTTNRVPANPIVVSLSKEATGIASMASHKVSPQALSKKEEVQSDSEVVSISNVTPEAERRSDSHSFSGETHKLFLSQDTQAGGHHLDVSEGAPSYREAGSSVLNNHSKEVKDPSLLKAIRASIEREKSYPFLARKRGIEGTVLFRFKIDRRGLPQDIKIIKSSGYQILDEEVPKMLRKASPFPEVKGEIVIPVTFKLTESMPD